MTDPKHIDAVARVFSSDEDRCGVPAWTNRYVGEKVAALILDSTDPAVHAALAASLPIEVLIAELVERGWLEQVAFADWWGTVSRYVTKWEAKQ